MFFLYHKIVTSSFFLWLIHLNVCPGSSALQAPGLPTRFIMGCVSFLRSNNFGQATSLWISGNLSSKPLLMFFFFYFVTTLINWILNFHRLKPRIPS